MKRQILVLFLLIILLMTYPVFAQTTVIRAGNLIDPATGTIAKNQIILVKDGRIVEVGPKVSHPCRTEVIDLSNAG